MEESTAEGEVVNNESPFPEAVAPSTVFPEEPEIAPVARDEPPVVGNPVECESPPFPPVGFDVCSEAAFSS